MTLSDVIGRVLEIPGEQIVYVKKTDGAARDWPAISCREEDSEREGLSARGFTYLLEVFLIEDVIAQLRSVTKGRALTVDELVDAVLYYAENDAYYPIS